MQPPAALLEIGWTNWPSFYVKLGKSVGVKGRFIDASKNVNANWTNYEKGNKLGKLIESEKKNILNKKHPYWHDRNPYKWAETILEVDVYLRNVKVLMEDLEKGGVKF